MKYFCDEESLSDIRRRVAVSERDGKKGLAIFAWRLSDEGIALLKLAGVDMGNLLVVVPIGLINLILELEDEE